MRLKLKDKNRVESAKREREGLRVEKEKIN